MQIDITKLLTNQTSAINFEESVNIPKEFLINSRIDDLTNVTTKGSIKLNEENELIINAIVKGTMTLKDDLTLEPVSYNFETEIDEEYPNQESNKVNNPFANLEELLKTKEDK